MSDAPLSLGNVSGAPKPPTDSPYDPSRDRELVRGRIASAMVFLLFVAIGWPIVAALFGKFDGSVEKVATLVLTAIVGLVGTVLGFYFGGKDRG